MLISKEVSDGIIAPGFTEEAYNILSKKKNGGYLIIKADASVEIPIREIRELYGITLVQERNKSTISRDEITQESIVSKNKDLSEDGKNDMILGMMTLKYTQSNSVCYTSRGQTIGIGAGQQSRIDCVKLVGEKAKTWLLRQHPNVLLNQQLLDVPKRVDRINAIT